MTRFIAGILLMVLWAALAPADVSFKSSPTGVTGDGPSSLTIAGVTIAAPCANAMLAVCVAQSFEDDNITAVTFNGVAFTEVDNRVVGGNLARGDVWRLVNPLVGSAANVVVTFGGGSTNGAVVQAYSFCGVHQAAPLGTTVQTTGEVTSASASVTMPANGMALSCLSQSDHSTELLTTAAPVDVGMTERNELMHFTVVLGAGGTRATTGECGWDWNGENNPTILQCMPINSAAAVTIRRAGPMVMQ